MVERGALRRIRSTPPQTGLGRRDRMKNVKGAFELGMPENIQKKRILLVDDVYTTGATVNECARILLKGGAEAVDVLTLCPGHVRNMETITLPNLVALEGVQHYIFSRHGGYSKGDYASLNLSLGVGDETGTVEHNRHLILTYE